MYKKKCSPCYVAHPILCGMIVGFAVIGICGMVMAMKKKAKRLGKAAKQIGCDCMNSIEEATENMMESGMDMIHRFTKEKGCGC